VKTYFDEVLYVLACDEESRNDDSRLICVLWNFYYPSKTLKTPQGDAVLMKDILTTLPKFSSVERARRLIQNTLALYPPTKKSIAKKRRLKEELWRESLTRKVSHSDAKKILDIYLKIK
jgi:hypothetical protein